MDGSKRYKTMPLSKLDAKAIGLKVASEWKEANQNRDEMLSKREEWTANWRDLNPEPAKGPWENSSNFHVPLTLINLKAIHARLWQLFSDPANFCGVRARKEAFQEQENAIREFMQFVVWDYCNSKHGARDVFDEWLWSVIADGSDYLKLFWRREVHQYLDIVPVADVTEKTVFDSENLTGRQVVEAQLREKEVIKEEIIETPHIGRISLDDLVLPVGQGDPQTAEWCIHKIPMTAEDIKERADDGKFDIEAAEELLSRGASGSTGNETAVRDVRDELDGYSRGQNKTYTILERYGKLYVEPELDDLEYDKDIKKRTQEVVVWVDEESGIMLGWTYLYRISPSGIRPIFRGDFIRFPDRSHSVGVGEALQGIQKATNSIYNLRQDNGVLASTPFGVYRASSGLKPDKWQISPGQFMPVDDPMNDIRPIQIPFLPNFGYMEEDRLNTYAERMMTISDLNLGRSPAKVGMFRTASGAAAVQSESGIQLEINFDRLARTLSRLLQALFQLCRERMPAELFYRVTGDMGQNIVGKVNRETLKGEYDFEINVDVLGEGKIEGQQKAVMLMQTLINPAFTQSGVITPSNLYHLAKNFLLKHKIRRIDNFISPPPQYEGEIVTPSERVFRIVVGQFMSPPIEDTVRLGDDHMAALKHYESFQASDFFGLLTEPAQLEAFQRLIAKHQQMLQIQQAGANPNMTGMQVPREGFAPMEAGAVEQGTLGAPMGEVNGPVV